MTMDAAINRFIFLLKKQGVRISPAESLDAMQALAWVTLHDRDTVRTVLRSTLIKDLRDLSVFEELFDQFFNLPKATSRTEAATESPPRRETELNAPEAVVEQDPTHGRPDNDTHEEEALDIRDYFDDDDLVTHFNAHQDDNDLRLAEFGQNLLLGRNQDLLNQVMNKAMQLLKVRRVKNASHAGELNFNEAIAALDADVIADAVAELLDELNDLDVDENLLQRLSGRLDGGIANLPELLKRYLERSAAPRHAQLRLLGTGTPGNDRDRATVMSADARCPFLPSPYQPARTDQRSAHAAPQHEIRRHPVSAGHDPLPQRETAVGGALRRQPVRA